MLLDQILETSLLEVLELVILEVEHHLGTTTELVRARVLGHRERTTGLRLPSVTLVVVVLGVHDNLLRDQVRGIKPTPNCPIIEMSAPAVSASMNALVPDRAIVPRLFTKSDLVIPTPLSMMVSVLFVLSERCE